jgi:3-methyladenine DNA glycosylase AlkD
MEQLDHKVALITCNNSVDLKFIYKLCLLLVKSDKYEEPSIAFLLLRKFKKQFDRETFQQVSKWFDIGINNWAHTDGICGEILWELLRKNIVSMNDFDDWKTAENKFKRRAVPVALIKPMKKTNEFKAFYNYLDSMMMDAEREVHQGLGWFLREIWKKNPAETEEFLLRWKNKSARLIFQYACEKMTVEQKKLFKRDR